MMNNYGYYPNYNYFQPQAPQVPQVQQFQPPTPIQPTIQDERIWVASESAAEADPVTATTRFFMKNVLTLRADRFPLSNMNTR